MKKEIIISGAGGFLGSSLIEACLQNENYFITAISSQTSGLIRRFGDNPKFSVVSNQDLNGIDWGKGDVFVNCAFPRNADSIQLAKGMEFVSELLIGAVRGNVKSVINISSQSVYSQKRSVPARETDAPCLETKYAIGKYSTELLTNCLCQGIPHTNLRMASLIGPGFDQRVTNKMIDIALDSGQIKVKENEQRFGFLDIRDAVDGILLLLANKPERWQEVYNLGTERTCSLMEIAETVADAVKKKTGKHICIEAETEESVLNTSLDCMRIRNDFGFIPAISLERSVSYILENKLSARSRSF